MVKEFKGSEGKIEGGEGTEGGKGKIKGGEGNEGGEGI